MAARASTMAPVSRPGKFILAAVYLLYAAVLIRTLTNPNISSRLPVYLALEILYLLLLSLAVRAKGFTYEHATTVQLKPGQVVLIDLLAERGGVVIR